MKLKQKQTTFYCFSPPVMIATCIIEVALLVYTLYRYKLTPLTRISLATLGFLALFQASEFAVCGASASTVDLWSRIGYVSITLLPPLGIHLIYTLTKRIPAWVVWAAYGSGLAFAFVFGLSESAFQGHVCAGNYAVFQLRPGVGGLYFAYYYGWLIFGIVASLYISATATIRIRKALLLQAVGYLSFLLPTGIVNAIHPETIQGIPSIMCGFAIIYALTLAFGIMPLALQQRKTLKKR